MVYKQFYSALGKLLYSIASADGAISNEEKETLENVVRKELLPLKKGKDEFGTEAAFYTEFEFEILDDAIMEPEVAFESFINFIEKHKTGIDNRLISVTRKISSEIAESYYHKNEREKKLLEKLNQKLNEIFKEKHASES
jgi:hypothetical protein